MRTLFHETRTGKWIGRGGFILSPHAALITELRISPMGYVKDFVYRTQVDDNSALRERIIE